MNPPKSSTPAVGPVPAEFEKVDEIKDLLLPLPSAEEEVEAKLPAKFDPLQRYLQEISKYPLLSREEEEAVAKAYYKQRTQSLPTSL